MPSISIQFDWLTELRHQTELIDHVAVDDFATVVDQVATHQVGKHKDSHIVVLLLFKIAEAFGVNENNVDDFAVYIDWYRLVVDPETLSAGNYFAADAKAAWLTD